MTLIVSLAMLALSAATTFPVLAPVRLAAHARDSDHDGVPDRRDRCPGVLAGATRPDACGCATQFDYWADLSFDNTEHRLWYRRFWTGECASSLALCFEGKAGARSADDTFWLDIVDLLTEDLDSCEKSALRVKLWRLGREIGFEWSRDNSIRRIDTSDLMNWGGRLIHRSRMARVALADSLERVVEDRLSR